MRESRSKKDVVPGYPRYSRGDIVRFVRNGIEKMGKISVVDAHGTLEGNDQPSYDILVEGDNCLYKHIQESEIVGKI